MEFLPLALVVAVVIVAGVLYARHETRVKGEHPERGPAGQKRNGERNVIRHDSAGDDFGGG